MRILEFYRGKLKWLIIKVLVKGETPKAKESWRWLASDKDEGKSR